MSDDTNSIRAILQASFAQDAADYEMAAVWAADLAAACERGEAIDDRLRQVFDRLDMVSVRAAGLVAVKQQWEDAGRPTDDSLRRAMDRVTALIRQLSRALQTIEDAARSRRDRLAVDLDVCNRRFQMQRAYQGKS